MKEDWREYTIDDVAKIINGYAFKSKDFISSGVPIIKIKSLKDKMLVIDNGDFVDKDFLKLNEKYHIQYDDFVIAMTGSHITLPSSAVGRVAKSRHKEKLLLNQRVGKFKVKDKICDHNFLYYFLTTDHFFQNLGLRAKGAGNQANISNGDIGSIKIHLPPLPTQQKIANILSAYDDLIENNIKRIELLEEQAQLIYEEWFVRMKFPNYENTKINAETGLPEGWEIVTVNSLLAKAKSTKKIKKSEILDEGIIPVIDQSRDFIAGFTNEVDALVETEEPIIVFGDHTRVLKLVNFDFARGADGTQLIVSNSERMPQHLFYHVLQALDLSNYHYARHFKYLKSEEVVLPDVSTANSFEGFVSLHYQLIQKLRLQNQKLKEARDILLPRLMMGIIEV